MMSTALGLALILAAAVVCSYIAYYTGYTAGRDRADTAHRVECAICRQRSMFRHPTNPDRPRGHLTGDDAVHQWLEDQSRG